MSDKILPLVLVVESDVHLLQGILETAEGEGFRVTGASSLQEAFDKVHEDPPDLIFCDQAHFSAELRSNPYTRTSPIIVMLRRESRINIQEIKQNVIDDFLVKPFTKAELHEIFHPRLR